MNSVNATSLISLLERIFREAFFLWSKDGRAYSAQKITASLQQHFGTKAWLQTSDSIGGEYFKISC
jgi:hypothetical protein